MASRESDAGEAAAVICRWGDAEAAAKMADVGDGWRDYVCLEAANAGPDVITIAPAGRHVLVQTLSSSPL